MVAVLFQKHTAGQLLVVPPCTTTTDRKRHPEFVVPRQYGPADAPRINQPTHGVEDLRVPADETDLQDFTRLAGSKAIIRSRE